MRLFRIRFVSVTAETEIGRRVIVRLAVSVLVPKGGAPGKVAFTPVGYVPALTFCVVLQEATPDSFVVPVQTYTLFKEKLMVFPLKLSDSVAETVRDSP